MVPEKPQDVDGCRKRRWWLCHRGFVAAACPYLCWCAGCVCFSFFELSSQMVMFMLLCCSWSECVPSLNWRILAESDCSGVYDAARQQQGCFELAQGCGVMCIHVCAYLCVYMSVLTLPWLLKFDFEGFVVAVDYGVIFWFRYQLYSGYRSAPVHWHT